MNFKKKSHNREIGTAVFNYFGTVTDQSAYSILKRLDFLTWQRRISYCSIRNFFHTRKKVHYQNNQIEIFINSKSLCSGTLFQFFSIFLMYLKEKTEDVPYHPPQCPQCPQLPQKIGHSHKSEETLKVFYGEMIHY
jgi:hypothetical protein